MSTPAAIVAGTTPGHWVWTCGICGWTTGRYPDLFTAQEHRADHVHQHRPPRGARR